MRMVIAALLAWSVALAALAQQDEAALGQAKELFDKVRAAEQRRDYRAAIQYQQQMLPLLEKVFGAEHQVVAEGLDNLALFYFETGEYRAAVPLMERSIAILEKALGPQHPDVAAGLQNLALLHRNLGEHSKALPLYEHALRIREQALGEDHPAVVTTLGELARAYRAMGERARAVQFYERSLAIRGKTLGADHPRMASDLYSLAILYHEMGEYAKALPLYQRSLAIREKARGPEHPEVADSLANLAVLHHAMGEYARAVPLHERSLAIRERALGPEHPEVATSLNNLAWLYRDMGEYAKALPLVQRSLAVREKVLGRDHPEVAMSLNNLAALYEATGEYARALALYERSLAIREKALGPEHNDVARSLNDLAGIYQEMGEYEKALLLFQRGVAIREKALGPEHPDLGRILNHLAEVYRKLRQYAKAQPVYARALAIFEKTLGPEHPHVAATLHNYASLYHDMGEYANALPLYERGHAILEKALGPEHPDVATSLNNIAGVYLVTGRYEKALQLAQRSLLIGSGRAVPDVVWRAQERLSAVYGAQKQRSAAIFWGKQAVNTLQGLRARLTALERELQRSYLADKRGAYTRLADHLIEEGRLPEAQQVMAMLKEEEFFDFIRRDARGDPRTTQAAYTAQEESWARRYREIGNRLAAIGTELETLRRKARQGLTGAEQERRAALEGDLRVARQAFDRFLGELMKEIAQADARRALDVGERNLTNLRALQGTLASLGHGAVAVHYLMGEEKLRILLTTPAVQLAREAPVGARELNRRIEQFRRVLQDPRRDPLPLAREMYSVLVAPIAEDLVQAGARTLMVSLDGTLRYIPLAALHDGKRYLVEAYRLAIFTEAAKDKLKDAPQPQWRFAGLGLTREIEGFSPLSGVKEELEGIVKHGGQGVLPGEVHFDQAFTAGRVRDSLDRAFPVLHIASHFVFRPGTEADSFLLLGDGSRLTLREIKENDFDFRNVDLITLSACETAVGGGRDATGQEIEGLGALAQRQGAKGVLATLWPVADVSTGVMMQSFYAMRETQRGVTKAEALRQAQLQLIRGSHARAASPQGERGAKRAEDARSAAGWVPDPARPYAHPYFWAPFILMGNWL